MTQTGSLAEQIGVNFERLKSESGFGEARLWLTFYLWGKPQDLERLTSVLTEEGWVNVTGWEGGFIYPKIEVAKVLADITETTCAAQELVAKYGAEILNIDADTSADVKQAEFLTLYRSPK
jgi:hypothetical protein